MGSKKKSILFFLIFPLLLLVFSGFSIGALCSSSTYSTSQGSTSTNLGTKDPISPSTANNSSHSNSTQDSQTPSSLTNTIADESPFFLGTFGVTSAAISQGVTDPANPNQPVCVPVAGFDQSSCVTTSTGKWTNAILSLDINNPGPGTTITRLNLTGSGIGTIFSWSRSTTSLDEINFLEPYSNGTANSVNPLSTSVLLFYPITASPLEITAGHAYNYTISFGNGQTITGSLDSE
jgi:hypothetical protein